MATRKSLLGGLLVFVVFLHVCIVFVVCRSTWSNAGCFVVFCFVVSLFRCFVVSLLFLLFLLLIMKGQCVAPTNGH